jgi:hypothetical protein
VRFLALAAVGAGLTAGAVGAQVPKPDVARPVVEVVFVLDTTGSMGGLIHAAQEKVWAIANTLATAKPTPEIRMGLVGYRDRGDKYVTRLTGLTDDLDAVYADLMAFRANGGGDGPESVNQALAEAVGKVKWSSDPKAYRVIFLVGDFPPHMDYAEDIKYPDTCKKAAAAGIIINTIQCGSEGTTEPVWRDIASKAEGQYFRVEQSGGAILASTPFDKDLAELSAKLEGTRLYYGTAEAKEAGLTRAAASAAVAEKATDAARARRGAFLGSGAGAASLAGEHELLADVSGGKVKLGDVKDEELPESLRALTPEQRAEQVAKMATEREALRAKISEVAAQRQKHIEEQIRAGKLEGKQSLDQAIFDCIKGQAGKKGIAFEGGPAL